MSPWFLLQGTRVARAHGPAVEITMLRTWKQSPRRTPTFGLWSAAVIAADSLLVGARCALAAAVMASTPSAVAITASNLGRTLDMTCNVSGSGRRGARSRQRRR